MRSALFLLLCCYSLADETGVSITFTVSVPEDTPVDAEVLLVGDLKELGQWNPSRGLRLKRRADGRYGATTDLTIGQRAAYKVCVGSWRQVEKNANGAEIPNRTLVVEKGAEIEIEVARWADQNTEVTGREDQPVTITGTVRRHADFASQYLRRKRDILVYLPPDYEKQPQGRYAVFYLHDGQNLFNRRSSAFGVEWGVDETAERLVRQGRMKPTIIVGLYNTPERISEYTMPRPKEEASTAGATGRNRPPGLGDRYARFLVEEVKPFIDKTYRTKPDREHTAVGGSSLGGLISLYICSLYPETFSECAAISPALGWNDGQLLKELASGGAWLRKTKIWVDMGTAEGRTVDGKPSLTVINTRSLVEILDTKGLVPGRDYYYWEESGALHNEAAWARRIDKVLLFFFAE